MIAVALELEKPVRTPIGKKMRFDVFKRDNFCCQYCGSTPPKVVLEVDHIIPVSKGGKNRMENLLTSCFDCNRGKSNHLLDSIPKSVNEMVELLAEKMAQVKAFDKLVKKNQAAEESRIDEVEQVLCGFFKEHAFSSRFRESVRIFLSKLSLPEVVWAMQKACSRVRSAQDTAKYFCGICWTLIKDEGEKHGSR